MTKKGKKIRLKNRKFFGLYLKRSPEKIRVENRKFFWVNI